MLANPRFFEHKLFAVGAANMSLGCWSIGVALARWHDKNCQQGKDAEDAAKKEPAETATPTRCGGDARNNCDAKPEEEDFHVF